MPFSTAPPKLGTPWILQTLMTLTRTRREEGMQVHKFQQPLRPPPLELQWCLLLLPWCKRNPRSNPSQRPITQIRWMTLRELEGFCQWMLRISTTLGFLHHVTSSVLAHLEKAVPSMSAHMQMIVVLPLMPVIFPAWGVMSENIILAIASLALTVVLVIITQMGGGTTWGANTLVCLGTVLRCTR